MKSTIKRLMVQTNHRWDVLNRLLDNVLIDPETECWEWQGATSGDKENGRGWGYGRISVHGHTSAVHRVVWSMIHGYLPPSKHIDHKCNNRICCNPQHLELVTHKQNQRRRINK